MRTRRIFTREFKLEAVRPIVAGDKRIAQTCRELDLCESVLTRWIAQYRDKGDKAFTEEAHRDFAPAQNEAARIKELEASLGRAHLEIEFLKDALAKKGSAHGRQSQ